MDGVKARLPEPPSDRRPAAFSPGIEPGLARIEAVMAKASFFEITNRIRVTSFSIQAGECLGKLHYFVWGTFDVLVFKFLEPCPRVLSKVRDDLESHGWEGPRAQYSAESLVRVLNDPSEIVVSSQILLLLNSLGLPSSTLRIGPNS